KATPSTPEGTEIQDSRIHRLSPIENAAPPPEPTKQQAVTTKAPAPVPLTSAPVQPAPRVAPQAGTRCDLSQLSQEIASPEAQLAEERQQYAERPRVHRLNSASTRRDPGAFYMDSWRRKIERIGNQNYPAEARSQGIYGSLVLRVAIRRDGSLDSVELIE